MTDTPLPNSTLFYQWNEPNHWYYSVKNYLLCYERYYQVFNSHKDLKNELSRSDVNTICKKELTELRKHVHGINFKEMLGKNPELFEHTQD